MNILSPSPVRKWFPFSLTAMVISAWFCVGYHHPDEHFQVLEYCGYKMCLSPARDLPWEFATMCRPSLQPFIAYCLGKMMTAVGLYNPFRLAFLLRLFTGICTWWVMCRLVIQLMPQFVTDRGRQVFVWGAMLLWFVPYTGVRFSAESCSAICFLGAISILLPVGEFPFRKRVMPLLITGLLLGFALFFRLQMAFALLGLGVWLLFVKKAPVYDYLVMAVSFVLAIGISVAIDRWFYGVWVFSPYNYFNVNIIQHMASKFGEEPWWYYFTIFLQVAGPPLSIVLLLLFMAGVAKKPNHLFSLVCITFIIGHMAIGHKELRFLYPISFPFIFMASAGLDGLLQKYPWRPAYGTVFKALAVMNCAMLVFRIFTPAEESVNYFEFIYNYVQKHPGTRLVSFEKPTYWIAELNSNFYKPQNTRMDVFKDTAAFSSIIREARGQDVLFLSQTLNPGPEYAGYHTERLYCMYPDWVLHYNINSWQERSRIWAVYRVWE